MVMKFKILIKMSYVLILSLVVLHAGAAVDKDFVCQSESPLDALFAHYESFDVLEKLKSLKRFSDQNPMENGGFHLESINESIREMKEFLDAKDQVVAIINGMPLMQSEPLLNLISNFLIAMEEGIELIQFETTDSNDPNKFEIREERIEAFKKDLVLRYTPLLSDVVEVFEIDEEERDFLKLWSLEVFQKRRGVELTDSYIAISDYLRSLNYSWDQLPVAQNLPHGFYIRENTVINKTPGFRYRFIFKEEVYSDDDLSVNIMISSFAPSDTQLSDHVEICSFKERRKSCELTSLDQWCE